MYRIVVKDVFIPLGTVVRDRAEAALAIARLTNPDAILEEYVHDCWVRIEEP